MRLRYEVVLSALRRRRYRVALAAAILPMGYSVTLGVKSGGYRDVRP